MAMQRGSGGEGGELGEGFGGGAGGFLGMDAGAGVDVGGRRGGLGDFEGAVHVVGAVADADGEEVPDAGGVGAGEDLREVSA